MKSTSQIPVFTKNEKDRQDDYKERSRKSFEMVTGVCKPVLNMYVPLSSVKLIEEHKIIFYKLAINYHPAEQKNPYCLRGK